MFFLDKFVTASRLLVVAGKGGVGKTTVSAALARAVSDTGLTALVVELEGKPTLARLLAGPGEAPDLGYEDAVLVDGPGQVRARRLTPSDALGEYLRDHGLGRLSRRLANTGVIDIVSTAAPGIDDILVLGKLKQLERATSGADAIIVDGPAAGHAVTFLLAASGLLDAVRGGPIRTQAADVAEMLADPARCAVVLVTLPEETPVNELLETAALLRERVGVALAAVVVNGFDAPAPGADGAEPRLPGGDVGDALVAAWEFRRGRRELHAAQLARVRARFEADGTPIVVLPLLPVAGVGMADVAGLARCFTSGHAP